MTLRERILAVYSGGTPDVVPFMLDLSHWFYQKHGLPWDLSRSHEEPERDLIEVHKQSGVGFYVAQLGAFYSTAYPDDVAAEVVKRDAHGSPSITWRLRTPVGTIERTRLWEEQTYAWGIREWAVRTEADLRVLQYALANRTFSPTWQNFNAWVEAVGDTGVVYMPVGYSAVGHLLNYWMGIEGLTYAIMDWPDTVRDTVDAVNANILKLVDLLATSPAEIIIMGDNISSDVQSPRFFSEWSRPFYEEGVRRLHAAGKRVAVHIDGKLRGALAMVRDTGADCGDAITPTPMGDLTPAECREEAGPDFILSGGPSPGLWLPEASVDAFKRAAIEWIEIKHQSPRVIANAGDQVPPGADENRIRLMRDLVEEYGRY